MHLVSVLFSTPTETSFVISNHLHQHAEIIPPPIEPILVENFVTPSENVVQLSASNDVAPHLAPQLPMTSIVHSAPGYTIFRNLYMSNGTLFILSPNRSFPDIRMIISTSIFADASPENIAAREPNPDIMDFIIPEAAQKRWGGDVQNGVRHHIFTVEGNTVLFNDPSQFLRHYYHFVAELFFGVQAFWHGAFSASVPSTIPDPEKSSNPGGKNWNAYPIDPQTLHKSAYQLHHPLPPQIHRSIFMHSNADGWRDDPGFNSYFLRAAFPAMSVEHQEDWNDRIAATNGGSNAVRDRAWLFPVVMVVDRSAAFRESMTGSHTQRTAAQAWEYMRNAGRLRGELVGGWWESVRNAVLFFSGAGVGDVLGGTEDNDAAESTSLQLPISKKVMVTYVSRQAGSRRKLSPESHESLVAALRELANKRDFDFNVMEAETLTKEEQLQVIAKTTILLGVHGNGLTHLVFMPPTRFSAVIEIFYPGGFAHDYHWTARALGMPHFAVWNDTYLTHPDEPKVAYPEGFQGDSIPVYGPLVAKIVEDRLDGKI